MTKTTLWTVYERDANGNPTIYHGEEYQPLILSIDMATTYNQMSDIFIYTKDWERGATLPTSQYQFGRYRDPEWRARERGRLLSGDYAALPWSLTPIPDHFAHVSIENDTAVAFTPDENKGIVDIQTRMKPGRYLTKFYPHLTSDEVRALACQLDRANGVRFATTPDEFERVYTHGPNSCMAHRTSSYEASTHPVRVYAAGDLHLAYLATEDLDSSNFRASARALVYPARKVFGRLYGDEIRLRDALISLGYTNGNLDGARLSKIEDKGTYVMPYIDWSGVDDKGSHFVIKTECPDYDGSQTNGLLEDPEETGNYCAYYEEYRDEELTHVEDIDEYWSESAIDRHAWCCNSCDRYYTNNATSYDMSGSARRETWCSGCFETDGFFCERTDIYLPSDDGVLLEDTSENVSTAWAEANAWQNPDTGLFYAEQPQPETETETETDPNQLALTV